MKQLLLYVQDPHALKNWSQATDLTKKILYTLDIDQAEYSTDSALLLVQLPESETEQQKLKPCFAMALPSYCFPICRRHKKACNGSKKASKAT